jgi:hypothetical protein
MYDDVMVLPIFVHSCFHYFMAFVEQMYHFCAMIKFSIHNIHTYCTLQLCLHICACVGLGDN